MKQTPFKTLHFMRGLSSLASRVPLLLSLACLGLSTPVLAQENISQDRKAEGTRAWALPVIEAQPQSQAVTVGQKASFSVKASGRAVTYQWFKNGKLIWGAIRSSYTTANTLLADNGSQYAVRVMSLTGTVWSEKAVLTVNPTVVAPSIVAQPATTGVTLGQSATFNVVAEGTNPLNYQWFKDGIAIAGATTETYITPPTVLADNGAQFTVSVSNSAGTVTSNPGILHVVYDPLVVAPNIIAQPAQQVVRVGESATFNVGVIGADPFSFQWFKNGVAIEGATTNPYNTAPAVPSDNGAQFTVAVSNSAGTVTSNPGVLHVGYDPAPSIIAQPAQQVVRVGEPATFNVGVVGSDPLSFQWFKNGEAIQGANAPSYTTPPTVLADNGAQFTVSVNNFAGIDTSKPVILTVDGTSQTGVFVASGSMSIGRWRHTATALPNGKILVAGGYMKTSGGDNLLSSAELYDPSTGAFSPTGSMASRRTGHTATLLDNGKVLIAGGTEYGSTVKAEIYDPATGTSTPTGQMHSGRSGHTATLLPGGNVLIAGGGSSSGSASEIYNVNTGTFEEIQSLNVNRHDHTATMLPDFKVLLVGGYSPDGDVFAAELYDYKTKSFRLAGNLNLNRSDHTATLLPDGAVLIAGGTHWNGNTGSNENSAEIYDPVTGTFAMTGRMDSPRACHTATLLPNGQVLIAGGLSTMTALIYHPEDGSFSPAGNMVQQREAQKAVTLKDGRVLFVGGYNNFEVLASSETYLPEGFKPGVDIPSLIKK